MSNDTGSSEDVEEPIDEVENRDLTISDAFHIGVHVMFLRTLEHTKPAIGSVESHGILQSLAAIQNRLVETNTSMNVAQKIESFKIELHQEKQDSDNPDPVISDELASQLSQSASTWEQLLLEKLSNETRINIPTSGLLDFEQMMYDPGILFQPQIWHSLDQSPKEDIAEASRALAVRSSSASVMVSLRAVEHYLKRWYKNETDEELERGTWGSVLDDLFDLYISEEDTGGSILQQLSSTPDVLSNLYYLKRKRDQVGHGDESPSDYDAVMTLFMVANTISEICIEIGEVQSDTTEMD